ncbi:putative ATPase [Aminobacter ciceronei]|uniref:ATPase n=2 Tax=Aminobacter ciceronei TaxID=150723 RepID=A0ABR6CG55_9HYPH|nr:putative ATPase [Aminobacter ciceronei]MBA9023691.1 putative ATPase [Aminobacter ciceronei]
MCEMLPDQQKANSFETFFPNGSAWVRVDFHLHTRADKEFAYTGQDNDFVSAYIAALKAAGIRLGVVTNHNKFDLQEFRALRRAARQEGIGLLPGVELSVNDGANGVHALIMFSDEWLENGHDFINAFLGNTFSGRTPTQYENENARSNEDIVSTLKTLEQFNRDFLVVFAHVEASSGLWNEVKGGRMQELAANPLVQKYCLGFQKVRTHDVPDRVGRTKVKQWWPQYPAEVEGSDPKSIEQIGKGEHTFLKLGDLTYEAVKFALRDFEFRAAGAALKLTHGYIEAVRFEGGLLDGVRIPLSPHLNCLIGIQGSGKSSALECLRWALDIPFGDRPQDRKYKEDLVPFVLKSGGRVTVEAVDHLGSKYEVRRILGHDPEVYLNGVLRRGVAVRQSVIRNPLYFGQKDLSAAGQDFGKDLVEKLVGESLRSIRESIATEAGELKSAVTLLQAIQTDTEKLTGFRQELAALEYQIEQFDKHGVKDKLEKQLAYNQDASFVTSVDEKAESWSEAVGDLADEGIELLDALAVPGSKYNAAFFADYALALAELKASVASIKAVQTAIDIVRDKLGEKHAALNGTIGGLKEEFASVERELLETLADKGVTALQPDDYLKSTDRKRGIEGKIAELVTATSKAADRRELVANTSSALNEKWLEEYRVTAAALDKINNVQSELKITSTFKGDKKAFTMRLEAALKGSSVRSESIEAICGKYVDFAAIYANLDEAAALAKGRADAFREYFLRALPTLLTFQVPNTYEINYHGRPLRSHSLGQRASAMMLFLLSQQEHDLVLIDQPEDDLDSQTVYEEVVKRIRKIKSNRQFIFATHNANFPVLGDSESVSAFSASDDRIAVSSASIDAADTQKLIIRIMEGGPEAFARRKTIYEHWKAGR